MSDAVLTRLRDIIQADIGKRGLATDPRENLINACPDDFAAACRSIAEHPDPGVAIVTGFYIPTATPPAGETDGPLGALFLARALTSINIPAYIVTDEFCVRALETGLKECRLRNNVPLVALPTAAQANEMTDDQYWSHFDKNKELSSLSHLLAIERVGISHANDRCHTMRGRDITDFMSPAHRLFLRGEGPGARGATHANSSPLTIGIGDGGNEIGMGKIPWDVIKRNIPGGDLVACRIATDYLIVCGVSNWGAYALAAGIAHVRSRQLDAALFDPERERQILEIMVKAGPLVDGVTGQPTATVDGLTWEQYANVLVECGRAVSAESPAQPRERY